MMKTMCPYESTITKCVLSRMWSDEALNHLRRCSECNQLVQLADVFQGLSVDSDCRPLPDPNLLWITAQIMKKQESLERVCERVLVFEICWFVLMIGGALVAFNWTELNVRLEKAVTAFQGLVPPMMTDLFSVTFASLALALAILVVSLSIRPLLGED